MTTNMILVTGGTGQQGGAVVRSLLRQGAKVRLLTRNRAKAQSLEKEGAEVAVGDFTDRNSLDAALKGVKKLFLMT
ncbi:MAG: SDR family NAD(P)-dependent oxidoreductase, partial [Candidatus Manganitrophaceae bacterium]